MSDLMPAIQSISCAPDSLVVNSTSLNTLIIPSTVVSVVENWLNTTYLPSITNSEYQLIAHVFSTNPLVVALYLTKLGEIIPANWWSK